MRSSNPALNPSVFDSFRGEFFPASQTMTVQGAATNTLILLGMCLGTGMFTYSMTVGGNPAGAVPWWIAGLIGGFVFSLVTCFKPSWAPITAPLYALSEGLVLGGLSGAYAMAYHGIVTQAALATLGTLAAMMFAYKTGLIRATDRFVWGVMAATGGIAVMYLIAIILAMFHIQLPFLFHPNPIGIGISAIIVVVAACYLIIDFAVIEQAAATGAPRYMEWYTAMSLMITLVWLYVEILRLLALIAEYTREK